MKHSLRTKTTFLLLAAFCALTILLLPAAGSAADCGRGKELFRTGRQAFQEGRYGDAVKSFSKALTEFPVLADYTLEYLAESYQQMGDHTESLEAARKLIKKYPDSPLVKKARALEITEAAANSEKDLASLYRSYVKDYPGDEKVSMQYGLFLKAHNEPEQAAVVFKKLYIQAGDLADTAYAELAPGSIKPEDLLARAANLIGKCKFTEAERELRKALPTDCGRHRREILRSLAYSLFKQRKYEQAAKIYGSVGDVFLKARSLYRAGDEDRFDRALGRLLASHDGRVAPLLLASASDKRRDGKFKEALRIYRKVRKRFPTEREDALWGMGWTEFMRGRYRKSARIFSELYRKYDEPKYLYWEARSRQELGEDVKGLFRKLAGMDDSFYGVLAYMRNGGTEIVPASVNDPVLPDPAGGSRFKRVEALMSLDMKKEAVTELSMDTKKIDTFPELLYIMSKFQELGAFDRSIGLATKVPYPDKVRMFLYPFAFREDVEEAGRKYGMDPMITLSVMREESRFKADAVSGAGARGLMQIMPRTAYRLDKTLKLGIRSDAQITDAKTNIFLGTYYLKSLFNEFDSFAHAFAAYNAGENAVKSWEEKENYKSVDVFIEDIPYPETRNYVKRVITSYFHYRKFSAARSGKKNVSMKWENL